MQPANKFPNLTLIASLFINLIITLVALAHAQSIPLIILSETELNDGIQYDAWVEFTDKNIRTERQRAELLEKLEKEYDPRAIARRKKRRTFPGLFDERDFPLAPEYLAGVGDTGAAIRIRSRWLNGVSVLATKTQITAIKKLPYVKNIGDFHEHTARATLRMRQLERTLEQMEFTSPYGYALTQVSQLGLDRLHKAGYTGKGIVIAVIDCGFALSHAAFKHPAHPLNIIAQWDIVENDDRVTPRPHLHPDNYDHGTKILGIIASYMPGQLIGTAYDADIILCNAEEGLVEFYLEERWFVAALEFAEAHGADIATSSLVLYGGYPQEKLDGKTPIMTQGVNIATGNGVICLNGAGNFGHDEDAHNAHLAAPADAREVITVGAVTAERKIAGFSSDGPTADGRLKPEVLALGREVATVATFDSKNYSSIAGTSAATPLMAGAVACLLQAHPEWTLQELREALFFSGDHYRAHGQPDSLHIRGYGIPDYHRAFSTRQP